METVIQTKRLYNAIATELKELFNVRLQYLYGNDHVSLGRHMDLVESHTAIVEMCAGQLQIFFRWGNQVESKSQSYSIDARMLEVRSDKAIKQVAQRVILGADMWGLEQWYEWCRTLSLSVEKDLGIQLAMGTVQRGAFGELVMVFEGETHIMSVEIEDGGIYKISLVPKNGGAPWHTKATNKESTIEVITRYNSMRA